MREIDVEGGQAHSERAGQSELDRRLLAEVETAGEEEDGQAAERVKKLLRAGARPSARRDNAGRDALILAAMKGFVKTCEALIAEGADASVLDSGGFTALAWAAQAGSDELVWALAPSSDMGQKIGQAKWQIWEAIAGRCSWEKTTSRWIPQNPEPQEINRAMMWAVSGCSDKIAAAAATRLAALWPTSSRIGGDHCELLSAAIRAGNEAAVEALIVAGADSSAKDAEGRSAFAWAAMMGRERTLRLLAPTSDVNEKDSRGSTPLALSLRLDGARPRADVGALAFLVSISELDAGPDGGLSVLALARRMRDEEAVGLIEREVAQRDAVAIEGAAGAPSIRQKERKTL